MSVEHQNFSDRFLADDSEIISNMKGDL